MRRVYQQCLQCRENGRTEIVENGETGRGNREGVFFPLFPFSLCVSPLSCGPPLLNLPLYLYKFTHNRLFPICYPLILLLLFILFIDCCIEVCPHRRKQWGFDLSSDVRRRAFQLPIPRFRALDFRFHRRSTMELITRLKN